MRQVLCLIALVLLVSFPTRACSIRLEPKVEFDPSLYIFEGRVVGFIGATRGGAVLIEPTAVVNTPRKASQYAVFPAGLGSRCEPIYSTVERLKGRFELGDRVYVLATDRNSPAIARDAVALVAKSYQGVLTRAEPLKWVNLARDPWPMLPDPNFHSNFLHQLPTRAREEAKEWIEAADSESYREHWQDKSIPERAIERKYAGLAAISGRTRFEYERDLARLHASRSQEENMYRLVKIRAYQYPDGEDCVFSDLVHRYLPSSRARTRLGGYILVYELRPLPTRSMCQERERFFEDYNKKGGGR